MILIKKFAELGRNDAPIAGGKGASLGEMTQAGIPVPRGFVVLSSAFERFLEETDLNVEIDSIINGVDTKAMHTVEHASETIQKLILEADMPEDIKAIIRESFQELESKFVAVRSSATAEDSASAAWAGQLDSFLNTTEETLLENVQRCWASLFTPRAIFYRFEQGLSESKISVAVVVQKMVESEVSGIAFSVHPVTEDRNQLIIEAGFGLGEAIVSGQITPDSYVVGKSPREIIDINVSTQTRALYRVGEAGGNEWRDISEPKASSQVLTKAQILELSELIIHIENHYGFPCDIEWAYEAGKFYIVQSRPITTLSSKEVVDADNGVVRVVERAKGSGVVTELSFDDLLNEIKNLQMDTQAGQVALCAADLAYLGYAEASLFPDATYDLQIGYVQNTQFSQITPLANMDKLAKALLKAVTENPDHFASVVADAKQIERDLDKEWAKYKKENLNNDTFCTIVTIMKNWWQYAMLGEDKGKFLEATLVPVLSQEHTITTEEARNFLVTVTHPDSLSVLTEERLAFIELCIEVSEGSLAENTTLINNKTSFHKKLKKYAETYFYKNSNFYDRTQVTPESVIAEIQTECKKNNTDKLIEMRDEILENQKKIALEKRMALQKVKLSKTEEERIAFVKAFIEFVDTRKASMMKCFYYFLSLVHDVCEKTGTVFEDVQLLTVDEISGLLTGAYSIDSSEIERRREGVTLIYRPHVKTQIFTGDEAKELYEATQQKSVNNIVKGTVACAGRGSKKIQGIARIVINPSEAEFREGEIMVTSMTRIEFVPLMKKARAIITDEGGIACHAAIVSRELGVTCIIGTKIATQVLKDGDLVEVDADNGVVRILEKAKK